MLTFVLILSRTERPINGQLLAHISQFERRELVFEADQHLRWSSPDRRISLNAWQAFTEQGQIGSHWHINEDRVTLLSGSPIRQDSSWIAGFSRAQQMAALQDTYGDEAVDVLRGPFTLIDVRDDGPCVLRSDPEGSTPLFQSITDDTIYISNRASLVAYLKPRENDAPERDWRGPAATTFAGVPIRGGSGFAEVGAPSRNTGWRFGTGLEPEEISFPSPARSSTASLDPRQHIDQVLRQNLRAAAELPYQRHRLMIDGGLASRLLLGVCLDEGLIDRFTLTVCGDPDDPHVQTAASLAAKVGQPLEVLPSMPPDPADWQRQAQLHLFRTNGIGSLWNLQGRIATRDELQIHPIAAGLVAPDARVRRLLNELLTPSGVPLFDPRGLLEPEYASLIDAEIGEQLLQPHGLSILAAAPESAWPLVEAPVSGLAFPFLDAEIWAALELIPIEDLVEGALGHSILQSTAPELIAIPFTDTPSAEDQRVRAFPELQDWFRESLLEPFNPMLDVLQIGSFSALVDDPRPNPDDVHALYDLLTMSLWLSESELVRRIHRADELGVWGDFSPLDDEPNIVIGDVDKLPQPNTTVRHPGTDLLLDAAIKMAQPSEPIPTNPRVLAVIPHFNSEGYLRLAIESLLAQTRPLDGIVVIDDRSPNSLLDLVADFPDVTFLRSHQRSGPYRLIQTVFDQVDYDAYLFQDADDWSAPERLEILLDHAATTGQVHVGGQPYRIYVAAREAGPFFHPFDAAATQRRLPTIKSILHPTSLVTSDHVERTGGFSTGFLFGSDAEFLRRGAWIGHIGNTRGLNYFYRVHSGSLTNSADTGMQTPVRQAMMHLQHEKGRWNAARVAAGLSPVLWPLAVRTPAQFEYLGGPPLRGRDGTDWPEPASRTAAPPRIPNPAPVLRSTSSDSDPRPVFLIGAKHSGTSYLAACLAQHPNFLVLSGPDWIVRLASALRSIHLTSADSRTPDEIRMAGIGPNSFVSHFGAAANALLLQGEGDRLFSDLCSPNEDLAANLVWNRKGATRFVAEGNRLLPHGYALHSMFPNGRFIHILRDPEDAVRSQEAGLPRTRTVRFAENRAYDEWCHDVEAATTLEAALGSDLVLRVDYPEFIGDPEATLRTVLEFIEEPWDDRVLRPFL